MKLIFNPEQDYWVTASCNPDFLCIATYSGLGRAGFDPSGAQYLLALDADNHLIGESIFSALSKSRTLTLEECEEFFDLEKGEKRYADWITALMVKYNYKIKRSLFRKMKNCTTGCHNHLITISPSHHKKLQAWSGDGFSKKNDIILADNCSVEELGAGLRLALSRCTGL